VNACREAYPNHYIKVVAYDSSLGRQTSALSFMVNRPAEEPGFRLERQDKADRQMRYTLHPYAQQQPIGRRYGNMGDLATSRDPAAVQDGTPGRDSANGGRDGA
jgi:ribulose-bisphosphate carboxylase small chain